jgi:drug/metabolite transporter (DMT)-like permease
MGLLSSMISLGEPLTWSLTVGLVGIVLGLALVNMADLHAARRARAQ